MRRLGFQFGWICISFIAIGAWSLPAHGADEQSQGVVTIAPEAPIYDVDLVAYQQPPARSESQPAAESRRSTRRPSRGSSQASSLRLASVPKMFGDVQFNGAQGIFVTREVSQQPTATAVDFPLAGGARRLKIGENNSALPEDRVLFLYNHFENAITVSEGLLGTPTPVVRSSSVDRYTFGIEKTYWDEMASVEVRMPIVSSFDLANPNDQFFIDGGSVGNLAIISKYLLYAEESWAVGAGMAVDLPTGSDVTVRLNNTVLTVNNDALHLLPFVGVAVTPTDDLFFQAFAQVDFATNGNQLTGTGLTGRERFNDQNLLYLDIMGGAWLWRDTSAPVLTGLAAITELHYTSTIQDADFVEVVQPSGGGGGGTLTGTITNTFNRIDVLNLTAGLQAELGNTTAVRVAAVAPLGEDEDERFFDAELQVQVNRRY